ncbi:hypothetical protein GCM10011514_54480 [Emticicia aquatilis]|uniref:Outer membrane protein beta-barrel domain-containing protein n=1 Tax=Emticicia aquatilis TaxID=1537369 RepID=A0A916ZBA2_9BACT|nr:hypothetical protein [Emticicia aquatilis]GGD83507.1 hypothetical protein GCM10011514_54480 [Emticicia aquatilis]
MKTDKFDEAFRRKVENFHPPFSEDEIDRVQGYVNQHIPLSLWQRFGHIFTYSVGTLMILTLLTTTIFQANENKSLLNKISELNQQLEQKSTQTASKTVLKEKSSPVIVEKIDTVYVVKHIKHEIKVDDYEESIAAQPQTNSSENTPFENGGDISENTAVAASKNSEKSISNLSKEETNKDNFSKNINKNTSNATNKGYNTSKKRFETIAQQNSFVGNKSDLNSGGKSAPKDYSENKESKITQNTDNQANNTTQTPANQSELEEVSLKTLSLKDLKSKGYNPLGLSPAISFADRQLKTARWVDASSKKFGFRMPQITLPSLKYRVGLGSNIDNGQIGTSILTEVLFSKRWSMTTGLNVSFLGFEHFGDEDDFKRKTERDFREQHDLDLPLSSPIKDIEAHQVLFRIPLYLNYRLPLRKDYTVLFSTGTDLDVNLRQITSFSHHDFIKENQQEGLTESIKVTPFNNWMLSTGIEKRWKRFSVQLSPYVSYQLKTLSYRNNDWLFGLKLNGLYRVSR